MRTVNTMLVCLITNKSQKHNTIIDVLDIDDYYKREYYGTQLTLDKTGL